MGTPDFAVPALAALVASHHEVVAVYSQPPRAKGRGHVVQPGPIQAYATQNNIPVRTPTGFREEDTRNAFAAFEPDVAVVAAYGLILPESVLSIPKYGCINIHASLLPRWRGASPIHHAIWKGDGETGITIMKMEKGLDTGPMLASSIVPINPSTTTDPLHDMLAELGGRMIGFVLDNIETMQATPQDDRFATYAPMLKKEDGKINWADPATDIDRQIRALSSKPGTYCTSGDRRLKVLEATPVDQSHDAAPGTVLDDDGLIACGRGALHLVRVQPDAGKAMDIASAYNGKYLRAGTVLS
jgi:methionyl-tRNA formyltransferase